MSWTRLSLARQVSLGLILYGLALSVALFAHGWLVNEHAEQMVWEAMLQTRMSDVLERERDEPDFHWENRGKLDLYRLGAGNASPTELEALSPGVHDNVFFDDNEWVVLIHDGDRGTRYALALDIDGFEALEWRLIQPVIISSMILMLLLSVGVYFGVGLLVRPLRQIATRISALSPDRQEQRIEIPARASSELEVIAEALNDYLDRHDRFVERERAFINTASHELRTPISVIRSAVQVAKDVPDVPLLATRQLERIAQTTSEIEELITMLLILARDPEKMIGMAEQFRLDELIPELVRDHHLLCDGKQLDIVIDPMPVCTVVAPERIVRIAIGNLLRNAIESSDQGQIRIGLDRTGCICIQDPGHGMTPEQISELYARFARGAVNGSGIGLALIARISEHMGWKLEISSRQDRGTRACLDLSRSRLVSLG